MVFLLTTEQKLQQINDANGGPLNIADPVQLAASEYLALHMWLDARLVPVADYKGTSALTLIGRVIRYTQALENKVGSMEAQIRKQLDQIIELKTLNH